MNYGIISGKGGTGKTFIATYLATTMKTGTYIDCDIEEPNGHIFLQPTINQIEQVRTSIPKFNENKCTGCKKCVSFCQFNALALIDKKVYLMDNLCHSCHGCEIICEENAIEMIPKIIGQINYGKRNNLKVITGQLKIGESTGVPIIHKMLQSIDKKETNILDGPPGSGCEVIDVIKESDYCIFVVEPTAFGFHNFLMVKDIADIFGKKVGVIINKSREERSQVKDYCLSQGINIIGEIPYNNSLANKLSKGEIIIENSKEYKLLFKDIYSTIKKEAKK